MGYEFSSSPVLGGTGAAVVTPERPTIRVEGPSRLGITGDSIAARNVRETAPTSVACAGGVATFTMPSSHFLVPGMRVHPHGYAEADLNRWFTVESVPSSTTFTIRISRPDTFSGTTGLHSPVILSWHQKTDNWLSFAEGLSGREYGLTVEGLAARGGRKSDEILAQLPVDGLGYRPRVMLILMTVNDIKGSVTAETALAAHEEMVRTCLHLGVTPVLMTPSPYGGAFNTTANMNGALQIVAGAHFLAQKYDIDLVDSNALITDPASATGAPRSGWLDSDNLHWSGPAKKAVGTAVYPVLDRFALGKPIRLVNSLWDDPANAGSTNVLTNSSLSGSSAAGLSGGATGVHATSWTLANSGLASCVGSKGTLGPLGVSQIITVPGSSGNFAFSSPSFHASLVGGRTMRLAGMVRVNLDHSFRLAFVVNLTPTGGSLGQLPAWSNQFATDPMPAGNYTLYVYSNPLLLPQGATYSAASVVCQYVNSSAGTAGTVEFAAPSVWQDTY